MVPWPIAVLSLVYGVIAAASAATAWRISAGLIDRPIIWPVAWLALSVAAMCGLALLKPWARTLAIVGLALIALVALAVAGLFIVAARPWVALLVTLGAGIPLVMVRYLRRPTVRAFFVPDSS